MIEFDIEQFKLEEDTDIHVTIDHDDDQVIIEEATLSGESVCMTRAAARELGRKLVKQFETGDV